MRLCSILNFWAVAWHVIVFLRLWISVGGAEMLRSSIEGLAMGNRFAWVSHLWPSPRCMLSIAYQKCSVLESLAVNEHLQHRISCQSHKSQLLVRSVCQLACGVGTWKSGCLLGARLFEVDEPLFHTFTQPPLDSVGYQNSVGVNTLNGKSWRIKTGLVQQTLRKSQYHYSGRGSILLNPLVPDRQATNDLGSSTSVFYGYYINLTMLNYW